MNQSQVAWQISQLRRTKWLENDDPKNESGLTFAAHTAMSALLDTLQHTLEARCPQDIATFRISDKTYGEISFQWYGPVFELDVDISADGQTSYLFCKVGAPRESWDSVEEATPIELAMAILGYPVNAAL